MLLQQAFAPSRIKVGLESESKDELFEELVDLFARDYRNIPGFSRDSVLDALLERESKMSTGIMKGIALPHARVAGIPSLAGVMGISTRGIDYDSLDGFPVYLVFMLVSPPNGSEIHLQGLKTLARLLGNPDFYLRLLEAPTPDRAYSILKSFEEVGPPTG